MTLNVPVTEASVPTLSVPEAVTLSVIFLMHSTEAVLPTSKVPLISALVPAFNVPVEEILTAVSIVAPFIAGLVSVLLVKVCVPVSETKVAFALPIYIVSSRW